MFVRCDIRFIIKFPSYGIRVYISRSVTISNMNIIPGSVLFWVDLQRNKSLFTCRVFSGALNSRKTCELMVKHFKFTIISNLIYFLR